MKRPLDWFLRAPISLNLPTIEDYKYALLGTDICWKKYLSLNHDWIYTDNDIKILSFIDKTFALCEDIGLLVMENDSHNEHLKVII